MRIAKIVAQARSETIELDDGQEIPGCIRYEIAVGDRLFEIRAYDNEPGGASVSRPSDANLLPEARELVDFIVSVLGREIIDVYSSADGAVRRIDNKTLAFKTY